MGQQRSKTVILAGGENTQAHTHRVESVFEIDFTNMGEETIKIELKKPAVVLHEEHDRIVLNEGVYYKTNQVEFNPFTQSISFIFD